MSSNGETRFGPPPPAIVGVGASAGGVEALTAFVSRLPADLPAAVLVVLHISRTATSALGKILDRAGPLGAATAVDGEPLVAGRIYVAPADHHLLADGGRVRLTRGPGENGHRPSVDAMLRSIAAERGARATGVILSGSRDDGTFGLLHVKAAGGRALAQEPAEALFAGMPASAAAHVALDGVLRLDELAAEVTRIAREAEGEDVPEGVPKLRCGARLLGARAAFLRPVVTEHHD